MSDDSVKTWDSPAGLRRDSISEVPPLPPNHQVQSRLVSLHAQLDPFGSKNHPEEQRWGLEAGMRRSGLCWVRSPLCASSFEWLLCRRLAKQDLQAALPVADLCHRFLLGLCLHRSDLWLTGQTLLSSEL